LADEIDTERKRLTSANDVYEQAVEERVAATSLIVFLDSTVDGGVMDLSREVSVITHNKTDDPLYRTLFPIAPSTAMKPVASDSQNTFVKALIDRIETDSRYESLRGRVQTLKVAEAELEGALKAREDLRTPEVRAAVDLSAALDSAKRAYNKLPARLSLIFDNKAFIETFFVKNPKPGGADEEEGDESPETATPTGAGSK
jgi:hypothetical protein